jgi:hypothetical protein
MNAQAAPANLSTVTTQLIVSYGNTANNVIKAYRASGERVVDFLEQRWDSAFKASATQLTPDVKQNAQAAHRMVGGYCAKGLTVTTESATSAVNQLVKLAAQGVDQVAANAARLEEKTGLSALNQIALVAVPAAQAVTRLVVQLEQKSNDLVAKLSGSAAEATPSKRATPFKKARTRRTA